jgi:hypothetical protein
MLGRLESRRSGANATAKTSELPGVQRFAALIAFITPRFTEAAVRASTFHIAVRKKPLAIRAIGLEHLVSVDITPSEQSQEYIMCDLSVVCCTGSSEQVERDPQSLPAVNKLLMVPGSNFLRSNSLLLSADCNRCSVLVAARNHQHLVTLETMIARKNIGWQISTSNMAQM